MGGGPPAAVAAQAEKSRKSVSTCAPGDTKQVAGEAHAGEGGGEKYFPLGNLAPSRYVVAMVNFGSLLRDWRGERRQYDAAEALGVSPGQLCRLESGQRRPSAAFLARAAEVYDIGAADLVMAVRLLAEGEHAESEEE